MSSVCGTGSGALLAQTAYLYERTAGPIGSLRGLLADATARAILTGTEILDRHTWTRHQDSIHKGTRPTRMLTYLLDQLHRVGLDPGSWTR